MDIEFPPEPAPIVVRSATVLEKVDPESAEMELLRTMENDLHRKAASIVQNSLRAGEIDPEEENIPGAWMREMTPEQAKEAFRVAKAAWAPSNKAPAFLKLAQGFLVGVMKARATENQGPRVLNATLIQTTAPIPVFPEREVEK